MKSIKIEQTPTGFNLLMRDDNGTKIDKLYPELDLHDAFEDAATFFTNGKEGGFGSE